MTIQATTQQGLKAEKATIVESRNYIEQTDNYKKNLATLQSKRLPLLTGSDKQKTWANKIKDKKALEGAYKITVQLYYKATPKNRMFGFNQTLFANTVREYQNVLKSQNAGFVIDNRF